MKFPTTLQSSLYYLWDPAVVRPFVQKTFDAQAPIRRPRSPSRTRRTIPGRSDNIVNVHTYIGYTYDFFFMTISASRARTTPT